MKQTISFNDADKNKVVVDLELKEKEWFIRLIYADEKVYF